MGLRIQGVIGKAPAALKYELGRTTGAGAAAGCCCFCCCGGGGLCSAGGFSACGRGAGAGAVAQAGPLAFPAGPLLLLPPLGAMGAGAALGASLGGGGAGVTAMGA